MLVCKKCDCWYLSHDRYHVCHIISESDIKFIRIYMPARGHRIKKQKSARHPITRQIA